MSQTLQDDVAQWFALDWGTTHLRGWAMAGETVLGEIRSDAGMNTLADRDAFARALHDAIAPWLPAGDAGPALPILACGMVGARQGWREASYLRVPTPPRGEVRVVTSPLDRVTVAILPGVAQDDPPDVMRGEETQIAGLLAAEPDFEGLVCLPGTHTKWARVAGGRIEAFRTAMTGEMFDLLSTRSVLRHSVDAEWDEGLFAAAVVEGAAAPGSLPTALFGIRARQLLEGAVAGECRSRLSGLLIGAELAAIADMRKRLAAVRVIGEPALAAHYAKALGALGQGATLHDGARTTRAGLLAAYREIGPWS